MLDQLNCDGLHVFQTFAAGELKAFPPRQSLLDKLPAVKKTCKPSVLDDMLVSAADRRTDWQIYAIHPQDDEPVFRCIFGRADRTGAVELKVP